jgi:hypothetical protein
MLEQALILNLLTPTAALCGILVNFSLGNQRNS